MIRKLFSSKERCPYSCSYCFASWDNYLPQEYFSLDLLVDKKLQLVYPCCDGDFFSDDELIKMLQEYNSVMDNYVIISFSTKGKLKESTIKILSEVNNNLINNKKGFIKISISITNISRIKEIEPLTDNYEGRLKSLSLLSKYNIPSSVTIKPLLPFVSIQEYLKIIDDTSEFTNLYLLGDLYINEETKFFKDYIKDKFNYEKKHVEWLDSKPVWNVVKSLQTETVLTKTIRDKQLFCFNSDIDLLSYLYKIIKNNS